MIKALLLSLTFVNLMFILPADRVSAPISNAQIAVIIQNIESYKESQSQSYSYEEERRILAAEKELQLQQEELKRINELLAKNKNAYGIPEFITIEEPKNPYTGELPRIRKIRQLYGK